MSGLAALLAGHTTPDVYRWHNAAHVEDVAHAVEKAGWTFVHVDGWTVEDEEPFLKTVAAAFGLPDTAATSCDALAEALRDVPGGEHGTVVLWDGWSPLCRHDEGCFTATLEAFRGRVTAGGSFAVLLRGDGPDLELAELPDKPVRV